MTEYMQNIVSNYNTTRFKSAYLYGNPNESGFLSNCMGLTFDHNKGYSAINPVTREEKLILFIPNYTSKLELTVSNIKSILFNFGNTIDTSHLVEIQADDYYVPESGITLSDSAINSLFLKYPVVLTFSDDMITHLQNRVIEVQPSITVTLNLYTKINIENRWLFIASEFLSDTSYVAQRCYFNIPISITDSFSSDSCSECQYAVTRPLCDFFKTTYSDYAKSNNSDIQIPENIELYDNDLVIGIDGNYYNLTVITGSPEDQEIINTLIRELLPNLQFSGMNMVSVPLECKVKHLYMLPGIESVFLYTGCDRYYKFKRHSMFNIKPTDAIWVKYTPNL